MTPNLRELLLRLLAEGVELVVVGQVAGVLHGSEQMTADLEVVIRFAPDNLARVVRALETLDPRTADPRRLRLPESPAELAEFRNLYVMTRLGKVDLLGRVPSGDVDRLLERAVSVDLHGHPCAVESLDDLIHDKTIANRPKDRHALVGLRALRDRLAKRHEE
jgi:hypothetical protein